MSRNTIVIPLLLGLLLLSATSAFVLSLAGVLPDSIKDWIAVVVCLATLTMTLFSFLSFLPNKKKVSQPVFDAGRTINTLSLLWGIGFTGIGVLRLLLSISNPTIAWVGLGITALALGVLFLLRAINYLQIGREGILSSKGTWRWAEIQAYDWVSIEQARGQDRIKFVIQENPSHTRTIVLSHRSEHRETIREHLKEYLPGKAL